MKHKLIVLSVDSLFDEDLELMRTLPNFGRLLRRAAYMEGGMRSVYPSCTYPAHASLITGTWPEKHGIYHNQPLDAGNPDPDWFWFRRDLKTETLLDAAHTAGLTTACVSWPCMGGDANVDWLVPEIWQKPPEADPLPVLRSACSANLLGPGGVIERHCHKLQGTRKPFMDHMMIGCACDIIRRYRPDVALIHLAYLDDARHKHGVHDPAVREALCANDEWFGRLEEAAMDAGIYDNTDFAVISDHGHLNYRQIFRPNVLLAKEGLITLDGEGKIVDWKAYCHSASLSCQVFLKDPSDRKIRAAAEKLLCTMREDESCGVESVFTKTEAQRELHLDGPFDYVLEGSSGTAFGNEHTGLSLIPVAGAKASHGHLPHKGPQPVFIAAGPGFRTGAVMGRRHIIDVAPTFAKLLGIELPEAQGRAMTELLY